MMLHIGILCFLLGGSTSAQSLLRDQLRGHSRGQVLAILRELPRDSLIALAVAEAQNRYPDFDRRLFSYERVYTNAHGLFVSWKMAIRFARHDRSAIYGVDVNLVGPSVGSMTLGKDSQKPRVFRWDDDARKSVQSVLRLDDSTTEVIESFRYGDRGTTTIIDYGDYCDISKENPYGAFEGYKMDKKTRRTWDHISGIPGPFKSEDVEITE